jgi:hypothetical protein
MSLCLSVIQAQTVTDRASRSAKNKTNNRIDNKVNDGIDDGLDALEGLFKKKNKKKKGEETEVEAEATGNAARAPASPEPVKEMPEEEVKEETSAPQGSAPPGFDLSAFMKPAKYEPLYNFSVILDATIAETKKNGKQSSNDMVWMSGEECMGIEVTDEDKPSQSNLVIFDFKNQSMVTVIQNDEGDQAMAMPMITQEDMDYSQIAEEYSEDYSFSKSGRTKNILGYNCEEYIFDSEDVDGTVWVTKEAGISTMEMFEDMYQGNKDSFKGSNYMNWFGEGLMMESESKDEKGNVTTYRVTKIQEDARFTVEMEEYEMIGPMGR